MDCGLVLDSKDSLLFEMFDIVEWCGAGMADFAACLKLYHGLDLLVQHGMRPFYVFFNKVTLPPTPYFFFFVACVGKGVLILSLSVFRLIAITC